MHPRSRKGASIRSGFPSRSFPMLIAPSSGRPSKVPAFPRPNPGQTRRLPCRVMSDAPAAPADAMHARLRLPGVPGPLRAALFHGGTIAALFLSLLLLALAFFFAPFALFSWHPIMMACFAFLAVWGAQVLAAPDGAKVADADADDGPGSGRDSISDLLGNRPDTAADPEPGPEPDQAPVLPAAAKSSLRLLPLPLLPWWSDSSRSERFPLHLGAQIAALACGLLGLAAIVANKIIGGRNHFKSYHSVFGLITLILFFGQAVFGLLVRNDSRAAAYFRSAHGPAAFAAMRRLHRINAVAAVLPMAAVTLSLAAYENWTADAARAAFGDAGPAMQGVMVAAAVLAFVGVLAQAPWR
ncbi:hypothetical protein DFJ74DRAFT_663235 [Hyaloraphidium curvatum]|nr:hypothetical protein DFJ74DRAFT_663235 [Hyaloraphidium curvatum]